MQTSISKYFGKKAETCNAASSAAGKYSNEVGTLDDSRASGRKRPTEDIIDLTDSTSHHDAKKPSTSIEPSAMVREGDLRTESVVEETAASWDSKITSNPDRRARFMRVLHDVYDVAHAASEAEDHGDAAEGAANGIDKAVAKLTPLEQQVKQLKQQYPDCLLMVECGYRTRFFGKDAANAAAVLGIYAHKERNYLVASVPTYRTIVHCKRLVAAGHKVSGLLLFALTY